MISLNVVDIVFIGLRFITLPPCKIHQRRDNNRLKCQALHFFYLYFLFLLNRMRLLPSAQILRRWNNLLRIVIPLPQQKCLITLSQVYCLVRPTSSRFVDKMASTLLVRPNAKELRIPFLLQNLFPRLELFRTDNLLS
ncbi:hypothetical protein LEP1GSC172_3340 [Leptospira noguchii]|uniref:Uncharacterized protein n=1 Tax=Leptospira noguchii TaxID=28182 RepID=M6V8Y8_9LEPT|nr:hypothetical protein LEP1GSC172_3340 [Leptospira noguchii]